MNEKDVNKLIEIQRSLDSADNSLTVEAAKISNPSKEIESSLTAFIQSQFNRLQEDNDFQNLIRLHIRSRLGEATFEQLMELESTIAKNNTFAINGLLDLFKNDQSGKIITEHLQENNNISSTAQEMYNKADNKETLQAVSYLNQMLSKLQSIDAEKKDS